MQSLKFIYLAILPSATPPETYHLLSIFRMLGSLLSAKPPKRSSSLLFSIKIHWLSSNLPSLFGYFNSSKVKLISWFKWPFWIQSKRPKKLFPRLNYQSCMNSKTKFNSFFISVNKGSVPWTFESKGKKISHLLKIRRKTIRHQLLKASKKYKTEP